MKNSLATQHDPVDYNLAGFDLDVALPPDNEIVLSERPRESIGDPELPPVPLPSDENSSKSPQLFE